MKIENKRALKLISALCVWWLAAQST